MDTKARRVRCPKCRKVLEEPPEVQLYICGGCSTVLQAKKRKTDAIDTKLRRLEEEDAMGKQKVEQVSNDQETGSHSTDEPDQKCDDNELRSSTEGHDPAEKVKKDTLDHNGPRSSTELLGHDDPESSPEATAYIRIDQDSATKQEHVKVDAKSGGIEHSFGKHKMEQLSEDQETDCSMNKQSLINSINEPDGNSDHNEPCCSSEPSYHEDPASSAEATVHHNHDHSKKQSMLMINGVLENGKNGSEDEESSRELFACPEKCLFYELSEIEEPSREAGCSMNQQSLVNSINEPDRNSDPNEPRCSSELSYHEDPASSPEAMVHHNHNHDQEQSTFMINGALENSINESEDEESSRELFASPEKCSFSELSEIEEPSREAIADTKIVRDSDGGSKSSFKSLIAEKLLDTMQRKVTYLDEDDIPSKDESADLCHRRRLKHTSSVETLENAGFGGMSYHGYEGSVSSFDGDNHQVTRKNHIDLKGNEHVDSGIGHRFKRHNEFHPMSGQWGKYEHRSKNIRSIFEDVSPSRLGLNEFHENPRKRPPVIPGSAKMERLELLKMVQELQDQLGRTNISNAAQQVPTYYDRMLIHPGRYGQRMAFSGEAVAVNRRRNGNSCYHYCSQDQHFSAQLPGQHLCCNGPHYVPSTCCSSHCSGPLSPRHHSESQFFGPVHSKAAPDDYRPRNGVPKPHRSPKKRYVRPIAGGSPWVTCYRCSELLQLPQSFLVFKKRYHSLQCGACLKVLNFTLSNGTHVHRYYPEETITAPPSSEVEDFADSAQSQVPVSCSDCSFQKSYSAETDRYGLQESSEERRKATVSCDPLASTRRPSSKGSHPRKTISEIEDIEPASNCSPLHRLMGYASPSKVIRG